MSIDYDVFKDCGGQPKGPTRKRLKGRKDRLQRKETGTVRAYVFGRERDICRCCRKRPAGSMHEIVSRGRRGKVSRRNSIAVCGQLVGTEECCHTYLQQHEIDVEMSECGAEGTLTFTPKTPRACTWMRVRVGESLESPVMQEMEMAL